MTTAQMALDGTGVVGECHHTGALWKYERLVVSGVIEPIENLPLPASAYTVCGDCGLVFTAIEMVLRGVWPLKEPGR